MKAMQIKKSVKVDAFRASNPKGHYTKKWWEGQGTKEDVDKSARQVILTCKEIAKSDAFKEETRRRANELLPLATQVRVQAGKLETTDEQARLAAWQMEVYMLRTWNYDTVDARRTLKHPWVKVAAKKEAEPKEETKAPAKAPAKKATTRKAKAKAAPKKEEAAPKEEAKDVEALVAEHNEALFAQLLKTLSPEALERAIFRALYGEEASK